MPNKILLLNGAPGCGKDTVAHIINELAGLQTVIEKFALPLKMTAGTLHAVSPTEFFEKYDTPEEKDKPQDAFFGKTPREVQIAISEDLLKPLHGKDVFGKLMLARLKDVPSHVDVIISDSGFKEEAETLVEAYGAYKIELWQITPYGKDFSNDSRSIVDLSEHGVKTVVVSNDGTIEQLIDKVSELYMEFRKELPHALAGDPIEMQTFGEIED